MKKSLNIILCLIFPFFLFSQGNSGSFNLIENAYVNMSSVSFDLEEQFTVMGWMKWDANPLNEDSWSSVMTMNNLETEDYRQFWIQSNPDNSRLEFALQLEHGSENDMSEEVMKEGEWFHFAATFNGNQQKLYINGVEESGKMSTGNSQSFEPEFTLSLGLLAAWNFDQNFDGEVDKVSVWNSVLSQEEINSLMYSEIPQHNYDLVSYYSVSEVENSILNNEEEYNYIAINSNENIPSILAEVNGTEFSNQSQKYGDYSIWQSNVVYQKSYQSDEVFVSFDNDIYQLNGWYSFNQKPNKDSELWNYVGVCDDINSTFVSNDIIKEN
jgi:hypothetical protein